MPIGQNVMYGVNDVVVDDGDDMDGLLQPKSF